VFAAGMIAGLDVRLIKSGAQAGKKMARFKLEDLSGSIPAVCFPRTYEAARHVLAEDALVVVRARLEENAEEPGLIAEEIFSVEDALRRFEGSLLVHLEPEDEPLLPALKHLLQGHPGRAPLWLTVAGRDGAQHRVRVGGLKVALSAELAAQIDHLLGRGRVRLAKS
jgi:DNA polymerase-3 subunit alpha